MSAYQHIEVSEVQGVTVVRFRDDKLVEFDVVAEVQRELAQFVLREKPKNVLVSFAGVRLISSTALGAVLSLVNRTKAIGAGVKFCEMAPVVERVFTITELGKLLDIRSDEAAGVQAFSE
jgi:anti-anti-sigma factor